MIGSTDSHTGIPSGDENNFWGKFTWHEANATRATERFVNIPNITQMEWEMAASGHVAVWARENNRGALFDALARRECYATTGPRMAVRFFGGWAYAEDALARPDWVARSYEGGVPMGQTLGERTSDAPTFIVSVLKDPVGANLDRAQVVKGWVDADGRTHERVYDVARASRRSIKSTVNVQRASYTNDVGAASLGTVWRDPDFDPELAAFYYVRVIEIPTPRWTAFDAAHFGVDMPEEVPMVTRERAYTSPIWYVP